VDQLGAGPIALTQEQAVDVDYLSLPASPNRAEVFARARGRGPVFEKRLGAWIVLDPPAVNRLLQDERLVSPDASGALRTVEARYNISLTNLLWAVSILPLVANGSHHRQVRAPLAKHISSQMRRPALWREKVPALVSAALERSGKLEAVRGLLLQCVDVIFEDLTGVAVDFAPLSLTKMFDRFAGYGQLIALEETLAVFRARLASIGVTPESEGMMASFVILGRDSMLSTLAESIINLMSASIGQRLDGPRAEPPRLFSGVAVAERLVTEPFTFGGADFATGDRVRMYFGGYNVVESETERLAFFGAGPHSCLGRSLAVEVWSRISSAICKSPLAVAAVDWGYDRGVMFAMPKYVNIEFT
jgi:hypothetical protein